MGVFRLVQKRMLWCTNKEKRVIWYLDGHPGVPFSVSVLLLVYHNKKQNVRQQDFRCNSR